MPPYCFQSFCYVDGNSCRKNSEEDIYKSSYFPQHDVFYSYTTCNSTNYFWEQYVESSATNASVAGGVNISAAVPVLYNPVLLKQLSDGTLVWRQTDDDDAYYFDDSIPFGGIYIDYVNSLVNISNGDIQKMKFTHTSRASLKEYPTSSFTAAVRDVKNGLVDMAVGPFWITGERLRMTSFTVPISKLMHDYEIVIIMCAFGQLILFTMAALFKLHFFQLPLPVYDKTVLVIPRPGTNYNLGYEVQKVLEPFTYGLCLVVLAVIIVASLLSVWFTDREMAAKKRYGLQSSQTKKPKKKRKAAYFRLILDAFLEKGMFFFSAGIEQDMGASLPHKVLMFGFGFFILIAVSAYVANLAAILTQSGLEKSVGSMKEVIDRGIPICGHQALEEEIRNKWPKANWLFPSNDSGLFEGMLEAYANGECKVLAIGREDMIMDMDLISKMCELNLVFTDVLVTENPIAFPINPQLAPAFSYWMYLGEKTYGIDLDNAKQAFIEKNNINPQCEVELSQLSGAEEVDDFPRVSSSNMFLPIMFFVVCALTAVILQLVHDSKRKKGRTTTFGRQSTLDIYAGMKKGHVDEILSEDERHRQTLDLDNSDVDRVRICDFPAGDDFYENGAPQSSSPAPKSMLKGSIDGMAIANENADDAVKEEDNGVSHRIEKLVDSGVMEEVLLDCFDFFQEMKKLKKDQ